MTSNPIPQQNLIINKLPHQSFHNRDEDYAYPNSSSSINNHMNSNKKIYQKNDYSNYQIPYPNNQNYNYNPKIDKKLNISMSQKQFSPNYHEREKNANNFLNNSGYINSTNTFGVNPYINNMNNVSGMMTGYSNYGGYEYNEN